MSTQQPNRTKQVENRMDRIEKLMEDLLVGHIHTRNLLDTYIETSTRNSNELRQELGFLIAAVKGHTSQSSPPAHMSE